MSKLQLSLSAEFLSIRQSVIAYTGVVRSIAEQFGIKTQDPFAKAILHLKNPTVAVVDAVTIIKKAASPFSFQTTNESTSKKFSVNVVRDGIGFIVEGQLENGAVKVDTLSMLLA